MVFDPNSDNPQNFPISVGKTFSSERQGKLLNNLCLYSGKIMGSTR